MREFRCIVFTEHEVLSAVIERRRRAREKLPVGTILDVSYDDSDKSNVITNIRVVDDYGKVEIVAVRTAEAAAALVEYCLNRKIPMPAGSKKWLELIGPELTLLMTFDAKSKKKTAPIRAGAGVPLGTQTRGR